ncbi:MAG: hypothetical protein MK212_03565 [Saprospiraceae bacterium]|nr:hypothetical protein [Saprospiraceae bacterium]
MDFQLLMPSSASFELSSIFFPIFFILIAVIMYFGWQQQKQQEQATLKIFRNLCQHYNLNVLQETTRTWISPSNLEAQGTYEGRELYLKLFQKRKRRNKKTVYIWSIEFYWRCKNPHNVELRLNPEGFLNKLGKKIGMQDITTYNDEFDQRFMVKCNYKIFPVQMFTDIFCEEMIYLDQHFNFNNIKVSRSHLSFEDERSITTSRELALLIRGLDTTLELANMIDTFSPNQFSD